MLNLRLLIFVSVCNGFFLLPQSYYAKKTRLNAYVPDGLTKDEWQKIRKQESSKNKNFGANGPRGYKSRSFESFQRALENGDPNAKNMPMFFAKEKLLRGEIKLEDIPYMQRGGAWDNSDIFGAKKSVWTKVDKKYDSDQRKISEINPLKLSDKEMFKKIGAVERIDRAPKTRSSLLSKWKNMIRKTLSIF